MAKPKKMPSGKWRVRVYDYTDSDNKKHYRSFTAPTRKEVQFLANEYLLNKDSDTYEDMTLKEISKILEVSESRISQLHTKALNKMRKKMGVYMNILTE